MKNDKSGIVRGFILFWALLAAVINPYLQISPDPANAYARAAIDMRDLMHGDQLDEVLIGRQTIPTRPGSAVFQFRTRGMAIVFLAPVAATQRVLRPRPKSDEHNHHWTRRGPPATSP